jgi:hypothetical protein
MAASVIASDASYLIHLPQEMRYCIYDFAFEDATFHIQATEGDDEHPSCHSTNFPITLAATCRYLSDDVKKFLTIKLNATLAFEAEGWENVLSRYIPQVYLNRVSVLETSLEFIETHKSSLTSKATLPLLKKVDLKLGKMYSAVSKAYFDNLSTCPKLERDILILIQIFTHFEDFRRIFSLYHGTSINLNVYVGVALGPRVRVSAYFDVEICDGVEKGQKKLVVDGEVFKTPKPRHCFF